MAFHFPSPAARAAIGGAGRRPSYYRPRASRARKAKQSRNCYLFPVNGPYIFSSLAPPVHRGGGLPKALFPCPLYKGRQLAAGKTEGFLSTSPVYAPPASLRLPYSFYKGGRSDAITRFQFRSVHRQSLSYTRNRSAEFRYQKEARSVDRAFAASADTTANAYFF